MRWLWPVLLAGCGTPEGPVADAGPDHAILQGESIVLDASRSTGAEFLWRFPDGRAIGGTGFAWSFDRLGRIPVVLEVTGEDGTVATDTMLVRVGPVPDPNAVPTAASPVAANALLVVAAVPDLGQVVVIDKPTGHLRDVYAPCARPVRVHLDDALIRVACDDDQLARIDLTTDAVVTVPMPYGSRPSAYLPGAGGDWVALRGLDRLMRLDDSDALSGWVTLPAPTGVAVLGSRLAVGSHRAPVVIVGDGGQIEERALPDAAGPDSDTNARGTPSVIEPMLWRSDGGLLWLGGVKHNLARGETRDGLSLTPESTARATLLQLHPAGGEPYEHGFDNRDRVSALATNPHGDLLFVGHHGSGVVDVLDAASLQRVGGWTGLGVGIDGLHVDDNDLWVLISHERRLVALPLDDLQGTAGEAIRDIDLRAGFPEALSAEELRGKQVFHAAGDPRMSLDGYLSCGSCHPDGEDDGHTWDFTGRGEGLRNTTSLRVGGGTAPLHWSANFDEVQDFEGDIRRFQGGRGYLADADWDATSDPLGAPKAGLSEDLDALAAYLASLEPLRSPHRGADGGLTADAVAGEAVFATAGCAACHVPPTYTDSAFVDGEPVLHDVGTLTADSGTRLGEALTGLDTPTLRGLFATAPYLHDGSAATVREVLTTHNPGDQHGATSALGTAELDQLEAFLLQLE